LNTAFNNVLDGSTPRWLCIAYNLAMDVLLVIDYIATATAIVVVIDFFIDF